jgi:hypothetical protein
VVGDDAPSVRAGGEGGAGQLLEAHAGGIGQQCLSLCRAQHGVRGVLGQASERVAVEVDQPRRRGRETVEEGGERVGGVELGGCRGP